MPAETKTTGWQPGMLQDDDRKLSRWLASRPGARRQVREVCREIGFLRPTDVGADTSAPDNYVVAINSKLEPQSALEVTLELNVSAHNAS